MSTLVKGTTESQLHRAVSEVEIIPIALDRCRGRRPEVPPGDHRAPLLKPDLTLLAFLGSRR
jgi:hypothetical protein